MDFKGATDLLALPLDEVAKGLGKAYPTVLAYRNGNRRVPEDVIARLATLMREHGIELQMAADELEGEMPV